MADENHAENGLAKGQRPRKFPIYKKMPIRKSSLATVPAKAGMGEKSQGGGD
jgi:hypothetical protein